jgi:hypothetical protein
MQLVQLTLRQTSEFFRKAPVTAGVVAALFCMLIVADGHNQQRCIQLVLLLAALGITVMKYRTCQALVVLPRWVMLGGGVVLALGLVSSVVSYSPRHALTEVALLAALAVLAWQCANEFRQAPEILFSALFAFGGCCLAYLGPVALSYAVALNVGKPVDFFFLAPHFGNYRFLNHFQTIAIPLLVLLIHRSQGRWRNLWWLVTGLWWALLIMTGGRATMLGLFLGLAGVAAVMGRRSLPLLRVFASTLLLGGAVYMLCFYLFPVLAGMRPFWEVDLSLIERTKMNPASNRIPMWSSGYALALESPLLGVGPQHLAHFQRHLAIAAHPHNWMVQIAAEWGIVVWLLLTAALASALHFLYRAARRSTGDSVHTGTVFLASIAVATDSFLSGVIVMPISQVALVLFIGLAIGTAHIGVAYSHRRRCSTAIIAVAVSCLFVLHGSQVGTKWSGAELTPKTGESFMPRFWVDGVF